MRTVVASRITGSLSLSVMLFGGYMVNCDACPDPKPTDAPDFVDPGTGTSTPTPECGDEIRFRAFSSLNREECDGTDAAGNPDMFPPGGELQVRQPVIRKCPDGRAYALTEQFHVYWTVCNASDNRAETLLPYQLTVNTVVGGTETLRSSLSFTQPDLDACGCNTEVVIFNAPTDTDPNSPTRLPAGAYRMRLTGPYAANGFNPVAFEQVQVNP